MLTVPIHNHQATALLEVNHRGPGKCMYRLGDLCLGAVSRSDEQKHPVSAVDMRRLKAEAIPLLGDPFAYAMKRPAQLRTLAQPQVRQNFLQQNLVFSRPIKIKQGKQMVAESLSIIGITDC
jgi:hypothetical protein